MTDLGSSPLGRATVYAEGYDPRLLYHVEREPLRAELPLAPPWPWRGADLWTAYELSWLDPQGKPRVAIAAFSVPADSPRIVESKSVKLYFTAFNQTRFESGDDVIAAIARDLSAATGAEVNVTLTMPGDFAALPFGELSGTCLDALPVAIDGYALAPEQLFAAGPVVEESLYTRLFRSVCPVTGQPDYASVQIRYRGAQIDRAALLAYLVSFRRHPGFHEHCVKRVFSDLWLRCAPEALTVYARFLRRGGIDINPFRTSTTDPPPASVRTMAQ